MAVLLTKIAAALILPPGANLLLGVAGLVLWRRARLLAMLRAVEVFEGQGVRVYAAPTGRRTGNRAAAGVLDWLPSASALDRSRIALHELVGQVWYRLRY